MTIRGKIGVSVSGPYLSLEYLGTVGDLTAAGCLSCNLSEARQRWRKGQPSRDADGHPFRLHHPATKGQPDRWLMTRTIYGLDDAMDAPGMREIWLEGLPCAVPRAMPALAPFVRRDHLRLVWGNPALGG